MILIVIFVILILVFLLNRYLKKPYRHKGIKLSQLEEYLKILRDSGYDGGFVIIEHSKTKEFIQFQKHIDSDGRITLSSTFFPVKWNLKYFSSIKNYLHSQNLDFDLKKNEDDQEVIDIFCNDDLASCVKLVKDINLEVFKMKEYELEFTVWFENVCEKDIVITTK